MANVIEFTIRGTDQFSKPLSGVNRTLGTVIKTTAKAAAGLAAAGTALVLFNERVTRGIDQTAKFAQRLGIAVDKLSEFEHAARIAGLDVRTFDTAVQRATRRVAEAAQGTGEAQNAIRELGLDAKALAGIPLDKQFLEITDALGEVQSSSERVRLAFKLFDTEGVSLLQTINKDRDAFRKAAEDARFLGVSIGVQAAANAEEFQNQMVRLRAALTGVGRAISEEVTPFLTGLLKELANGIARSREAIANFAKNALRSFITVSVVVQQVAATISDTWDDLFTIKGFVRILGSFKDFAIRMLALWSKVVFEMGKLLIEAFKFAFKAVFELGKTAFQQLFDFITGQDIAESFVATLRRLADETQPNLEAIQNQFLIFKDTLSEAAGETGEALQDAFNIDLSEIDAQVDAVLQKFQTFGEEVAVEQETQATRVKSFIEELLLANQEFMQNMQSLNKQFALEFHNLMQQTIDSISQSIANVIVQGGSLLDAFKAIGKQILSQIIAILIKVALQRLLTAAIFKAAQTAEASTALAAGLATTFVNTMSSVSAIPIIGPFIAPAVAAANVAAAQAGAAAAGAAGAGLGASIAGAAAGGLENVPATGTFLLHQGERVLSPQQNQDLMDFMGEGNRGRNVTIENVNVHVLENATNADTLLRMDPNEMREVVAGPIIRALDSLDDSGIRPVFAQRNRKT